MSTLQFFNEHRVFTHQEFVDFWNREKPHSPKTIAATLRYYLKTQRLMAIKRGLYAALSPSESPEDTIIDPYLIAAKLAPDAILAYHTALEFHGKAYTSFWQFHYFTAQRIRPLNFSQQDYIAVKFPAALPQVHYDFDVQTVVKEHIPIRVTSLERTLVDVLDRIDLSGGWEEIWRSFEYVKLLKLDKILDYTLLLANATLAAKVGFYLEQRQEELYLENYHLQQLEKVRPKSPHYLTKVFHFQEKPRLIKRWNLIVPSSLLTKSWDELAEYDAT